MSERTPLDTIEKALSDLSPGEKAHLLQKVARELGGAVPGIDMDPGVCGGEACIARMRIPVWLLVRARRLGASEARLLQAYPTLRAEDLVNAWAYAQLHPTEIEALLTSWGQRHSSGEIPGADQPPCFLRACRISCSRA